MSELTTATDAPPPPPPPPPPADAESREPAPDASTELADALSRDGQEAGQSGSADSPPDATATAQEQAEPVGNELQPHLDDGAGEGPAGLSPELAAALPQETRGAADGADTPSAERPDVASEYPAEYVPSADPPPNVDGPHESPENWAADINPDRDAPGRDNNCADCARSVDSTWHGDPAAAAAMADPDVRGEPVARMSDWAGEPPQEASMSDVQQRLEELGPGSSAIVGFDRDDGTGHWFNAVNDDGTIKAVDGQSGFVESWPPSDDGLGFNENDDMIYSDAVFFAPDGKVVKQ